MSTVEASARAEERALLEKQTAAQKTLYECVAAYAYAHAQAQSVTATEIAEAAASSCSLQLSAYRAATARYALRAFPQRAESYLGTSMEVVANGVRTLALEIVVKERTPP